jgi:hypothetical protein
MKIHPVHAFSMGSVIIVVLCFVILVMKSNYDAGGAAVGGQSPTDIGSIIVYGSNGCGWCTKQKTYLDQKGISFEFVDCPSQGCPDFVGSYPTITKNGTVMQPPGYNEFAGPLTQ